MMGYVTIKRLDHYGELAVPTGKLNGAEAEFVMLNCQHGHHKVFFTRQDI